MLKEEVMLISVLVMQVVSSFLNVRRLLRSRCVVDIEKSTQGTNEDTR